MSQCLWWHHASWNKRNLKQALNHRLLFTQIHRVIKFNKNESKKKKKKKAKSDFKKVFFFKVTSTTKVFFAIK